MAEKVIHEARVEVDTDGSRYVNDTPESISLPPGISDGASKEAQDLLQEAQAGAKDEAEIAVIILSLCTKC